MFVSAPARSGRAASRTRTIAELCRRLDELPLALELAAARTVVFSPDQLLDRLTRRLDLLKGGRDADPRQQTMRAAIDWSYELLTTEEQRMFCTLSVFANGCTFEAAEEVADADADTLQSLLDKNLLRRRDTQLGPRYWMLGTIGDYAAENSDCAPTQPSSRRRQAQWCRDLAFRILGVVGLNAQRTANLDEVARFRDESDNARVALAWAWDAGEETRHRSRCSLRALLAGHRPVPGRQLVAARGDAADPVSVGRKPTPRLKVGGLVAFFVLADSEQAAGLLGRGSRRRRNTSPRRRVRLDRPPTGRTCLGARRQRRCDR